LKPRQLVTMMYPTKPENVDARLNPDPNDLASLYAIHCEHRLAA
jgi:hypothetical protein